MPAVASRRMGCQDLGHNNKLKFLDVIDSDLLSIPRTFECFALIEKDPKLDYCLPKKRALPGHILKHCYKTLDAHLERKSPMTFKIGYTHCPYFRWYNTKFGYCHDTQSKWEGMVVVYAGTETTSASFVEAAMIQRYMGTLSIYINELHACIYYNRSNTITVLLGCTSQ